MSCIHLEAAALGLETAFTVDASRVTFGRGSLREVGARARSHGGSRVALFTDTRVRKLPIFETVSASLRAAGVDVVVFDEVRVEPTDASFETAIRFATDARADVYVSLGGGSVIDTCKAANLYATHPAELLAYVNAPVGLARPVPGPLRPHVACPTTSGTGSEVTGIAIFDLLALGAKTGIAHAALRPTEAVIDADCTQFLPREVVAASGFDVLCHALESFTARPFTARAAPASANARPLSQGRNPWSDVGCRAALALLGRFFLRAADSAADREAREQVMWAATLAGIAFGNAGVHVPHAMSYAVAGLVTEYVPPGYAAAEPMVPHGMAVVLNAPAVFRLTADTSPDRHLEAAALLGVDARGALPSDAGEILSVEIARLMRALHMPNGVSGVGYSEDDVDALVAGTLPQARLLANAPRELGPDELSLLFRSALTYW